MGGSLMCGKGFNQDKILREGAEALGLEYKRWVLNILNGLTQTLDNHQLAILTIRSRLSSRLV